MGKLRLVKLFCHAILPLSRATQLAEYPQVGAFTLSFTDLHQGPVIRNGSVHTLVGRPIGDPKKSAPKQQERKQKTASTGK
jgi:hypothetical protein